MNTRSIIYLAILILVLGTGGLYIAYKGAPSFGIFQNTQPKEASAPSTASSLPKNFAGTFYLSLVPSNGTLPLGIYSYGLSSKSWSRILVDNKVGVQDYSLNISPIISKDGGFMALARKNSQQDQGFQIYTAALDGKNVKKITNLLGQYKRASAIDPSGRIIAFLVQHESSTASIDTDYPESWSVYLTDLDGNAVKAADGVNPIFSPDGRKLLILQNNGLHLFDISNYKKPVSIGLVAPTSGGRASNTMKLNLSKDGLMLSWSAVGKEEVVIYKINSWETFSLKPIETIKAAAYWSIFSPDDKYLAVERIKTSAKGNKYGAIYIYDVNNAKEAPRQILSLSGYDYRYVWFSFWQ